MREEITPTTAPPRRPPPFPAADEGVRKKRNRKGGRGRERGGSGLRGRREYSVFIVKGEGAFGSLK